MKMFVIVLVAALSGCATTIGRGFDVVGDRMADEARDYCDQPQYRRDALLILINGRLAQSNIAISVTCPEQAQWTK